VAFPWPLTWNDTPTSQKDILRARAEAVARAKGYLVLPAIPGEEYRGIISYLMFRAVEPPDMLAWLSTNDGYERFFTTSDPMTFTIETIDAAGNYEETAITGEWFA
jgi:hypothetical protein